MELEIELVGISLRTVNNHAGMLFLKLRRKADSTISARVTAALAYCLFNRLLISTIESKACRKPGRKLVDPKEVIDEQESTYCVSH